MNEIIWTKCHIFKKQLPKVTSDNRESHNYVELFESGQRAVQCDAITFLIGGFQDLLLWLREISHEP